MEKELEKLEKVVGKDILNRILDVLNVLGEPLTKESIILSDNNTFYLKKGHILYSNSLVEIILNNDVHHYDWEIRNYPREYSETLNIDKEGLIVRFVRKPQATVTSELLLFNDYWSSPYFISDLYTVKLGRDGETMPLDDYHDLFISYMNSKGNPKDNCQPRLFNDSEIVDIIIKLFDKPINDLVNDLKNNDQSWRATSESRRIILDADQRAKLEYARYNNVIRKAQERLAIRLKEIEDYKNQKLEKIGELTERGKKK